MELAIALSGTLFERLHMYTFASARSDLSRVIDLHLKRLHSTGVTIETTQLLIAHRSSSGICRLCTIKRHSLSKDSSSAWPGRSQRHSPSYGLGVDLSRQNDVPSFAHSGGNAGYKDFYIGYENGDGAVIMTSSDSGGWLWPDILRSISRVYNWSTWKTTQRSTISLAPSALTP